MIDREDFATHVKEALASLHDPVRLGANPLAGLLPPRSSGRRQPASDLRQSVEAAIESLRPTDALPTSHPRWLEYHLMTLRHRRWYSAGAVCRELGFSIATFYRYQRRALESVIEVLWQQLQREGDPGEAPREDAGLLPIERARDEAVKLARSAGRQAVSLPRLLEETQTLADSVADQRGLRLRIDLPQCLPAVYADPAMLRQALLNLLMEGMRLATRPSLDMSVRVQRSEVLFTLLGLRPEGTSEEALEQTRGFVVSEALLEVYGGRLWLEQDQEGGLAVCFSLPLGKPIVVLIIDDDPETARLYGVYLQAHDYSVRTAYSFEQAKAILHAAVPDLVLLDVLMPTDDGWDILQYLKTMPETAEIPVVVCSVLSQPDLALALGAKGVLAKPISEEALVRTAREVLAQRDSEG